jgi:hypothetical protein
MRDIDADEGRVLCRDLREKEEAPAPFRSDLEHQARFALSKSLEKASNLGSNLPRRDPDPEEIELVCNIHDLVEIFCTPHGRSEEGNGAANQDRAENRLEKPFDRLHEVTATNRSSCWWFTWD